MPEETTSTAQDNTVAVESANTETNQNETVTETTQSTQSTEQTTESTTTEQPGVPEQYADFAVPENFSAPIDDFKTWAKENNMTQEAAQSVVDFYTSKVAPQMQAQHEAQVSVWTKESTEKFGKEGIEAANNALSRFSTPEFNTFLQETGLGNHPEMIAIFKDIHSKISESSFVDSKTTTTNKVMFPNSPDMYK
jgi:hypothetical protein